MTQYIEFGSNHPLLVAAFLANLLIIAFIEYGRKSALYKNISAQEATILQNHESAIFLDIREKSEFAQGHLLDAISSPQSRLAKDIKLIEKYRDKPIIVYCASGNRSISASKTLTKHDFKHVYNMSGGIHGWQKSNLPITKR